MSEHTLEQTGKRVYLIAEFGFSEFARDGTTVSEWTPLIREITIEDACTALHLFILGKTATNSKEELLKTMTRERMIKARQELVAAGLLAIARDHKGRPIYRNGQIVYKITEKGIKEVEQVET